MIVKRLTIREKPAPGHPSPGFVHIPEMSIEKAEEFANQLTSERAVYGRKGRVWEQIYRQNHALDCFVYALAALYILGDLIVRTLSDAAERLGMPLTEAEKAAMDPKAKEPLPGFLNPRPRTKGRWSGWGR